MSFASIFLSLLPARAHTHTHTHTHLHYLKVGSSCSVCSRCVLPLEHMLYQSDFSQALKNAWLIIRNNKAVKRRTLHSATLFECCNSLWQDVKNRTCLFQLCFDNKQRSKPLMTTDASTYCGLNFSAEHDVILTERQHHWDDSILIAKSHASEAIHCDGIRKAHQPYTRLSICVSTDINTCSWLQVNDSKCSKEERALPLVLRHPSA